MNERSSAIAGHNWSRDGREIQSDDQHAAADHGGEAVSSVNKGSRNCMTMPSLPRRQGP